METSREMQLLQALRLKGRPTGEDLSAAVGTDVTSVDQQLGVLADAGLCEGARGRYKLSATGHERLNTLLADEQTRVDRDAVRELYERFDAFNAEFKQLITDWQMKDTETPNDHADAGYDQAVVDRLADLHTRFRPLAERFVAVADRLAPYPPRFDTALQRVQAGEHGFIARPMTDSYHTVWFELHEELIGLAGLSREQEARAGRAE